MKRLKIGVFGTGRGSDIAKNFMAQNCDIVAVCDFNDRRRAHGIKKLGISVTEYKDFDSFIEHDMDAVIVANYFHEHAEYAIKCLERGIHVYSECLSNGTMAKGVALIRAAEKSNAIYMLGENYPQMLVNREMQRVCKGGTLGKILYAEGEYNHPVDPNNYGFRVAYNYFHHHWRHYNPRTYYITHSLGPVMKATGATPKKVTAFTIYDPNYGSFPTASHNGDSVSIIMTQNDDGSVFRITGCAQFGGHHNAYRVCGTNGQIENVRGMSNQIMLRYNNWSKPEGMETNNLYEAKWDDKDEELINQSGHGGSDFITARMFIDCVLQGKQPEHPFDVHSAVAMSSTAILAHRAVLAGGGTYDIPDFHLEECRKQYENDTDTPYYGSDGTEPNIPCCTNPDFKPTEEQLKLYEELVLGHIK